MASAWALVANPFTLACPCVTVAGVGRFAMTPHSTFCSLTAVNSSSPGSRAVVCGDAGPMGPMTTTREGSDMPPEARSASGMGGTGMPT